MNNEDILEKIAYLDTEADERRIAELSTGEVFALLHDAIQIEMAKQGIAHKVEDVCARVASFEERMQMMRRELMRQRGTPNVIYVRGQNVIGPTVEAKPPRALVAFYGLGLGCSLAFATLLALSAVKVETIHPFISLLGLVGGLGWLTTAWTDLLLWKRENSLGHRTQPNKKASITVAA
jgi:hypothetical protein